MFHSLDGASDGPTCEEAELLGVGLACSRAVHVRRLCRNFRRRTKIWERSVSPNGTKRPNRSATDPFESNVDFARSDGMDAPQQLSSSRATIFEGRRHLLSCDTPAPRGERASCCFRLLGTAPCGAPAIRLSCHGVKLLLVEGRSQATAVLAGHAPPAGPCPGYYDGPVSPARGSSLPAPPASGRLVDTSRERGT